MVQKQEKSRLADLLVEMRLVDDDAMSSALQEHRSSGRRLPKVLADRRLVDEERLAKSVAAKLGLEAISLAGMKIHERVVALLPAAVATKLGVIPIAIKRTNTTEMLYLVMCDPLDTEAIGEVQRITGRQVRVLLATASDVEAAIEEHYRSRPPGAATGSSSGATAKPLPRPGLPSASKPTTPMASPPLQASKLPAPTAPPPRRADSGIAAPRPLAAAPRRAASQVGLPPAAPLSVQGNKPGRATPSPHLAPAPLATLVPPEAPPPVMRGSPTFEDAVAGPTTLPAFPPVTSTPLEAPRAPTGPAWAKDLPLPSADDVFRPTLIDSPRPAELQQLFVTELQREGPLGRARPSDVSRQKSAMSDLVFPSELDPPDAVSTRVDAIPDDEATAQPGINQPSPEADWDLAVKDWDSQDSGEQAAWARDGVVVVGDALGSPSGSADAPPRRDSDPVTTEAALADIIMVEPIEAPSLVANEPRARISESSSPGPKMAPMASSASPFRSPPSRPAASLDPPRRVPAEPKASFAALLAESRAQVELEEGEDIKTSQLELSEISAAELRREAHRIPDLPRGNRRSHQSAQIMELPIEMEESPHPFDGPKATEVPIGLERTGIIPTIDWEKAEFSPSLPVGKAVNDVRPLAGSDDIPSTPEVARLRAVSTAHQEAPGDDDIEDIQEVSLDPIATSDLELLEPEGEVAREPQRVRSELPVVQSDETESLDVPPFDSDSARMPVIEPSTLTPLMDEAPKLANTDSERAPVTPEQVTRLFDESNRPPAVRAFARAEEEPTNPRIEAMALLATLDANGEPKRPPRPEPVVAPPPSRPVAKARPPEAEAPQEDPTPAQDAVDRGSVLSALQHAFVETGKQEAMAIARSPAQDVARAEARALVAALSQGESLSSAERVQLVLAIGRLLLKKGLISADELMDEL